MLPLASVTVTPPGGAGFSSVTVVENASRGETVRPRLTSFSLKPLPYPTVKATLALVVPHSMRSVAPVAVSSIEIVNCSTGACVLPTVIGTRPASCFASYSVPH